MHIRRTRTSPRVQPRTVTTVEDANELSGTQSGQTLIERFPTTALPACKSPHSKRIQARTRTIVKHLKSVAAVDKRREGVGLDPEWLARLSNRRTGRHAHSCNDKAPRHENFLPSNYEQITVRVSPAPRLRAACRHHLVVPRSRRLHALHSAHHRGVAFGAPVAAASARSSAPHPTAATWTPSHHPDPPSHPARSRSQTRPARPTPRSGFPSPSPVA